MKLTTIIVSALSIGNYAFAEVLSNNVSVIEHVSSDIVAPLFHPNGVINLPKLEKDLATCDVVKEINEYRGGSKSNHNHHHHHPHNEQSSMEGLFEILFPFGPAGNSLLATAYISGPATLVLALIPSSMNFSKLKYLVSFATGGLLGDVFLHLLPESFFGGHESLEEQKLSFIYVDERRNIILGLFIFIGFMLFFTVDKLLRIVGHNPLDSDSNGSSHSHSHSHSHVVKASGVEEDKDTLTLRNRESKTKNAELDVKKEEEEEEEHINKPSQSIKTSAYLNLISDFAHNITDGLALTSSFYVSRSVGATTTIAVLVHEFPHEMGDFALLIQGGFTKRQLMISQFITVAGSFLGAFIGIFVQLSFTEDVSTTLAQSLNSYNGVFNTSVTISDLTLPMTAGGFLYIATVGVIPEMLEVGESSVTRFDEFKKFFGQLFFMGLGIGLMFFISWNH